MPEFLQNIDLYLFHLFNSGIANPVFDIIMPFITNVQYWIPVYILMILLLVWKGGRKGRICAVALIIAVGINNEISSHLLKDLFDRVRPCRALEDVRLLINCGPGKSFPSSHASNNFIMATILAFFYRKYLYIFFSIALVVAFSRVYTGVHYPLDIAGGALLGLLLGAIFILILIPIRRKFLLPENARGSSPPR